MFDSVPLKVSSGFILFLLYRLKPIHFSAEILTIFFFPNEMLTIIPRPKRKTVYEADHSNASPLSFNIESIKLYFHQPLDKAANSLGVCTTILKRFLNFEPIAEILNASLKKPWTNPE